MTKKFERKLRENHVVDTRKYRYIAEDVQYCSEVGGELHAGLIIKRCPIENLGTTAAINGWETVVVI